MDVCLVPFATPHADELVAMWRSSFESAVGVPEPHTHEQQRDYFLHTILPNNRVLVAADHGQVVGFVAASMERVDQLYVHRDYQGIGIGSQLLQWAKDHSQGHLVLFTFERNNQARRFYEARDFKVTGRGFAQQWQLPDIRYEWQIDDQTRL
jgi:GNAT superfamily N-acetyltransferase